MVEEIIITDENDIMSSRQLIKKLFWLVHFTGLLCGVLMSLGIYLFFQGFGWLSGLVFGLGLLIGPPISSRSYDIFFKRK